MPRSTVFPTRINHFSNRHNCKLDLNEHRPHALCVRPVFVGQGVSENTGLLSAPTLSGRLDGYTIDFVLTGTKPATGSNQPFALRSGPCILARPVSVPALRVLG
jgi:hypothetical protein